MSGLPTVLASSVIRSTRQGDSHGGMYLVDLTDGDQIQVIDWDDPTISWEGRGADRGLRGIAILETLVYIAASDELFIYDRDFKMVDSFRNPYLKHCHEIHAGAETLWLTSTGFDSVLGFDLKTGTFSVGYHVRRSYPYRLGRKADLFPSYSLQTFDGRGPAGPSPGDSIHINNVWIQGPSILLSGTGLGHMLQISDGNILPFARVPRGTHNAQPFRDGVLVNHTESDRIAFMSRKGRVMRSFPIRTFEGTELQHGSIPTDHARQAFGRGLCTWDDRLVIGGSSPATISAHDFDSGETVACATITMDVRNAIHGLEIWPF